MEPKPEIKRRFPNCGRCGELLVKCCCPAARNMFEALSDYMVYRTQLGQLEAAESECRCDVNEFHTCELCREYRDINSAAQNLMSLWGDNWASTLWSMREEVSAAGIGDENEPLNDPEVRECHR